MSADSLTVSDVLLIVDVEALGILAIGFAYFCWRPIFRQQFNTLTSILMMIACIFIALAAIDDVLNSPTPRMPVVVIHMTIAFLIIFRVLNDHLDRIRKRIEREKDK